MPEPMQFAEWCVHLDWAPAQLPVAVDDVPVLVINLAGFISSPARVTVLEESGVGKDDGVRLVGAQRLDIFVEVVDVASAARSVEPPFDKLAITRRQLRHLCAVVVVVGGSILITRLMAIPRREIDAETESRAPSGLLHVADHIPFAVAPRACLNAVCGLIGGPERKAVMMLGDKHHVTCACSFDGFHPLIRVELRRVEDLRVCGAIAPLAI